MFISSTQCLPKEQNIAALQLVVLYLDKIGTAVLSQRYRANCQP